MAAKPAPPPPPPPLREPAVAPETAAFAAPTIRVGIQYHTSRDTPIVSIRLAVGFFLWMQSLQTHGRGGFSRISWYTHGYRDGFSRYGHGMVTGFHGMRKEKGV